MVCHVIDNTVTCRNCNSAGGELSSAVLGGAMGLAAMDLLICPAEGADVHLDASDQAEGETLLFGTGVPADRAQLADPGSERSKLVTV